ncbi:MAG TPA: 2-dehydropantoate 2-reductase [Chthoniobacterales bacterium]|jgi:2-dehydropantoate 2-reductase|nr:2-dehydropantoate 2-reductase [Chthoniobacterales bacterium]
MKIAVIGAGAVGGYFGGRLASAGNDVVFLVRGKTYEALRSGPLRVKSINGDFEARVLAKDDPAAIDKPDAVLVAVKAWQVPEAAEAIQKMQGENSVVIPLQNGMEAPQQLAAILGTDRVAGGLCRIVAQTIGPGETHHRSAEPSIEFGQLEPLRNPERLEQLRDAFSGAKVRCKIPHDISLAMWEKFLFIIWGSLGAMTRLPIGPIRSSPELRTRLVAGLEEVAAIACAHGKDLNAETISKTLAMLDAQPAETTSSMQRDIMSGRPSELEAQTGAVVRFGRKTGIATPVHDSIYAALLPLERRARGLG